MLTSIALLAALSFITGDVQLFGVETGFNDSNLAQIDWQTGQTIEQYPVVNLVLISGLAYDPATDALYGFEHEENFFRIDRHTGTFERITDSDLEVRGLAFHPKTGDLYGLEQDGRIIIIDKDTGTHQSFGATNIGGHHHGLAFSSGGEMFAVTTAGDGTSTLMRLNPNNGNADELIIVDRDAIVGLSFHPDGTLFGSDNATDSLVTIDTATGLATTVGSYGNDRGHGSLAFAPVSSELATMTIVTGTLLSGGVEELDDSDDAHVHTRSGFGQTFIDLHHMEMRISVTTNVQNPQLIDLAFESRIDEPAGLAQIRLFNHHTQQFETVGQFGLGDTDAIDTIEDIGAADYVDTAGGGGIEVSIKHIVFVNFFAFTFESWIDWVEITVRP